MDLGMESRNLKGRNQKAEKIKRPKNKAEYKKIKANFS